MNVVTIWQEFLKIVTEEVGSRVVETWFKAMELSRWDGATKTVYIKAPNAFIKDWVVAQYRDLVKTHLCRLLNEQKISVIFLDESREKTVTVQPAIKQQPSQVKPVSQYQINQRYQFDSYIVGPHNALAFEAAKIVADKPGGLYNPLYIHGGSGLGKTHLLQAVGNYIRQAQPKARILYQSADRFVHEFIHAIRFDKVPAFEKRYKEVDVLIVDDIQLLANKEQTQEAFFQIYNALFESGKQIVFSCDVLPDKIQGITERLRTRLYGGLVADIQPPTLETKIEIIQKKAIMQKERINDDVAHFIATRVSSNVRELEGLLIRVLAFATLTQQTVSLELAHKVLERTGIETTQKAPLDLPRIADAVAKRYQVTVPELRSSKRQKNLVEARHVAMYFMRKKTHYSLIDIATFWCRKDHSTVTHAVDKVEQLSAENQEFKNQLERIESSLS